MIVMESNGTRIRVIRVMRQTRPKIQKRANRYKIRLTVCNEKQKFEMSWKKNILLKRDMKSFPKLIFEMLMGILSKIPKQEKQEE